MARIRTVKPSFFMNEELFELEQETGLPVRVAYVGLWTQCDREGRFEWRPRRLKAEILPYDDVDFSRVLHALTTRGLLVQYEVQGRVFGCVPKFKKHQFVNNREAESDIPPPPENPQCSADLTREARVDDASGTREERAKAEGKGKEGREDACVTRPAREEIIKKVQATKFAKKASVPSIVDAWLEHVPPEKLFKLASEAAVMNESYDDLAGRVVKLMPRKSGERSRQSVHGKMTPEQSNALDKVPWLDDQAAVGGGKA